MRSFLFRPGGGVLIGGIACVSVGLELGWGERSWMDISIVAALSGVTAAAIGAAWHVRRLLADVQRRHSQQRAVARLGDRALNDAAWQPLLDDACRVVAEELDADVISALELRPDGDAFDLRAGWGWGAGEIGGRAVAGGSRSQGGYTLASATSVILRDAAQEARFELSPGLRERGVRSGLSVTVGTDGGTWGVLEAHTLAPHVFSDHDVAFLESVAFVLASADRRGRAEDEAAKSLRTLEAVIDGTNDDIFVKDLDGRMIAVNEAAARTLGVTRGELLGHTLQEVVPGPAADSMAQTDREVVADGTLKTVEEHFQFRDGPRVFLTTKGPYRALDGTVLGTFGIARDITARKAQEQETARAEERFRLAQEGASMGTWDVDLATGRTTWSDGLRALFGVGLGHPTGIGHFAPLVHPADRERATELTRTAYLTGENFEFDFRVICPDGDLRWLLARTSSRRDESGALVRVLGVAVDITERKLAEEELVRSEETLRLAQAAGGLGAFEWDIENDVHRWTDGSYRIYGVDPAGSTPSFDRLFEHVHEDDRERLRDEISQALASGGPLYECAFRIVRPSGEMRCVLNRGTIFRDAVGRPTRMIGVTFDETDRRRAEDERRELEERLRQAEKLEAVGRLAGGVAHDFNNLLVAIRGYGEDALTRLTPGDAAVGEDIDAMLSAGDRGAALTRQLLAFGGRQLLKPEVLDLRQVVRETEKLLQCVIGENVRLVSELGLDPVVVHADRGQLEQVIMNLVVNGRDAMPGGGVLTIRVEGGDAALLSVSDDGVGMDEQTAAHIFEPFFTMKGPDGTGLGLATVHGIVAQSGGEIALDTAPGSGSTFEIRLPLCTDEVPQRADAAAPASGAGTETILLVEDDVAVRTVVSAMLSMQGYAIVDAADGGEAIELFAASDAPIPLVVSDLMMRGLDGRQTIAQIRALAPATKVLYMSGYTDDPAIRDGGLGDGTGFIQKPFSGDELASRVRKLLDGAAA